MSYRKMSYRKTSYQDVFIQVGSIINEYLPHLGEWMLLEELLYPKHFISFMSVGLRFIPPMYHNIKTLEVEIERPELLTSIDLLYPSLNSLTLHNFRIGDLTPLGKLVNLNYLCISCYITGNITPLGNLKQLNILDLPSYVGGDLTPLENISDSIKIINLPVFHSRNIDALGSLHGLEELYLDNVDYTDLSFLENLSNLKVLNMASFDGYQIESIGKLKSLTSLDLSYFNGVSIDPLEHLPKLKTLYLGF